MAHVILEWEGMAAADLVADAIIAVLLQVRFLAPAQQSHASLLWPMLNEIVQHFSIRFAGA